MNKNPSNHTNMRAVALVVGLTMSQLKVSRADLLTKGSTVRFLSA